MRAAPCHSCPSTTPTFAMPDGDESYLLCDVCLETWLASWPEDGARIVPLAARPVAEATTELLRVVRSALKLNLKLLESLAADRAGDISEDEAAEIATMRIAAHKVMNGRRVELERRASN